MTSRSGERDLAAGGRLADRQALGEVVQADADRDQDRQPARARHACHPGGLELGGRGRAGAEQALRALLRHPAVVVDEAEEADAEAAGEQRGEPDEVAPRAAGVDRGVERVLHRADAVLEHVEEEEEQDPLIAATLRRGLQGEAASSARGRSATR